MREGGVLMKMHTRAGSCWYIVPYGEVTAAVATDHSANLQVGCGATTAHAEINTGRRSRRDAL
jgi:hypothetical protein